MDQYETLGADSPYYDGTANGEYVQTNNPGDFGNANHNYIVQEPSGAAKRKIKNRAASGSGLNYTSNNTVAQTKTHHAVHPPQLLQSHSNSMTPFARGDSRDRIWNTSTAEERERIKEFWLGLGESERRGLVRIEKEAVLKKMKEQQKHSCSCTVCGRKRTAIEEELEVLYDAYYEELESYANHQHFGLDASTLPPPQLYDRSKPGLPPNQQMSIRGVGSTATGGHIEELDEVEEEVYSDEDEDDDISDDEVEPPLGPSGGIFNFGNSLTAQGTLHMK